MLLAVWCSDGSERLKVKTYSFPFELIQQILTDCPISEATSALNSYIILYPFRSQTAKDAFMNLLNLGVCLRPITVPRVFVMTAWTVRGAIGMNGQIAYQPSSRSWGMSGYSCLVGFYLNFWPVLAFHSFGWSNAHSRHRRSAALGTNVLLLGMGNKENENKHTALFTVQFSISPDRRIQFTTEREGVVCTVRSRSKSYDNDNAIPRWCSLWSQAWITKSTRVLLLCCPLGVVNCNLKSLSASLHLTYPHPSGCVQLQNLIRPFEEVIPVSGCRGQAGRWNLQDLLRWKNMTMRSKILKPILEHKA